MLETGRVVALERDAVWIETAEKTSCGSCAAKQACGQNLLSSMYPERTRQIRVSTAEHRDGAPQLHDEVSFELPDNALLFGALRVYLLPLAAMMLAPLLLANWTASELLLIISSIIGLSVGVAFSRLLDRRAVSASFMPKLVKIVS
ncbi:MAG: SoxR reducing system RseC family protein [Pseudomonadales bacterium]